MQNIPLSMGEMIYKKELQFHTHLRLINELSNLGCGCIELHGGEPTLYPKLSELISHCSSSGINTIFATNGLSMTAKLAGELVKAGLSKIRFSLDGPRECHDQLRGIKGAFERQIQAIQFIQKADLKGRLKKSIRTNVSSVNLERIEEVVDIAKSLNVEEIEMHFHSVVSKQCINETNAIFGEKIASERSLVSNRLLPQNAKLIKKKRKLIWEKACKLGIKLIPTPFFTLPAAEIPKGIMREKKPCSMIYNHCTIDAFGNIFPCEYLRFFLGNIKNKSLQEVYQNGRFAWFTKLYHHNFSKLKICDFCCYFFYRIQR
jgi:radical SAM protein with 4Fe4S-binding SPASM domain